MSDDPKPEDAVRQVFSVTFLRILATAALVSAAGLLAVFLVGLPRLESEAARFVFCLMVSLDLAIFFFVFYPARLEMSEVPVIKLPYVLVGPIVLFIVLVAFLLQLAPTGAQGARLLRPVSHGQPVTVWYSSTTSLNPRPGESPFAWYLVPEREKPGVLAGVYVEFSPGTMQYKAAWQHGLRQPVEVVLSRNSPTFEIGDHP